MLRMTCPVPLDTEAQNHASHVRQVLASTANGAHMGGPAEDVASTITKDDVFRMHPILQVGNAGRRLSSFGGS